MVVVFVGMNMNYGGLQVACICQCCVALCSCEMSHILRAAQWDIVTHVMRKSCPYELVLSLVKKSENL